MFGCWGIATLIFYKFENVPVCVCVYVKKSPLAYSLRERERDHKHVHPRATGNAFFSSAIINDACFVIRLVLVSLSLYLVSLSFYLVSLSFYLAGEPGVNIYLKPVLLQCCRYVL